jgi:putative ABC transport system permease protein
MASKWYNKNKHISMITTDLKIAVRNLSRNKVHSTISILGLGIGLGSIILLMALIVHEHSFDKFIPDHKNVCRIISDQTYNTPLPLAEEMKKDFPEVKDYFRFCQGYNVATGTKKTDMKFEQNFGFADTSIYKILGIKLIAGMPAKAYDEVTITEDIALKYFGKDSPLGKILFIKLNDIEITSVTVTGIYKAFPPNSTLFPDFIANIKLSEKLFVNFQTQVGEYGRGLSTALNWNNRYFFSYLVLEKNTDKKVLASKMTKYNELIFTENQKDHNFTLQPVSEIYLKSSGLSGSSTSVRSGNANDLKYYWAISFLVLLISVTNYIFLTRAATAARFHELGTRKVLGASQNILQRQILTESLFVTVLSLIPATFVIDSGMTFINNALHRTLSNNVFGNPVMWVLLIGVVLFTGMTSGFLIGYKISRTPSLLLLSGKISEKTHAKKLDYSFLVFHFSIYIILLVSVITVSKQISYSKRDIQGMNPKNVLVCSLNSTKLQSGFTTIVNEMEKIPGVVKVAGSSFVPPFEYFLPIQLALNTGERMKFDGLIIGEGMTELLGIEVIKGSSFGKYQPPRVDALFNESSAKKYNLKPGDIYMGVTVRGIVKDFHAHSFHTAIQPMAILQQNPEKMGVIAIKTNGINDKAISKSLREIIAQLDPEVTLDVSYLTDSIDSFYSAETTQSKIMGAFAVLASVLAVMGLFGVALISIARKRKEIGLRKVNGASIPEITYLINKDFLKWVVASFVIGLPLSFYLMTIWQRRFAYKTELSWWIFAAACISAVLIALLTVSWQSWRAATRNPVEVLRYE